MPGLHISWGMEKNYLKTGLYNTILQLHIYCHWMGEWIEGPSSQAFMVHYQNSTLVMALVIQNLRNQKKKKKKHHFR